MFSQAFSERRQTPFAGLRIFLTVLSRPIETGDFTEPQRPFSLSIGEVAIGQVLSLCSSERILGLVKKKGMSNDQNNHQKQSGSR
jgi:hypothetical protein